MLRIFQRKILSNQSIKREIIKRFYLSEAYKCSNVWNDRLRNETLKKVDVDSFYYHLDINLNAKTRISVVDVDLFLNSVKNAEHKNQLEDILLRLRLCPESGILPERGTHAAIRWYLENASKEDLLNALGDRLNFGLFPDHYLVCLMLDNFIRKKDCVSAVKVAVLQMLQEDFNNPLTKAFSHYACFYYLNSSEIWENIKESEPDPDEPVEKVRVRFLRNPFFDDHFDITNTNHLVGKTLWMLGTQMEDPLGVSSQLIGLVLYEKFEKCNELLANILKNDFKIHAEAVKTAKEYLKNTPKQNKEENEKAGRICTFKEKTLLLVEKLEKKNLEKGSLLEETENILKETVKQQEQNIIQVQTQLYRKWELEREAEIAEEIQRQKKEKTKAELQKIKEELQAEEEKIFFFDKEENFKIKVLEKEKEKESVVFYKPKRKSKELTADGYIPPQVREKFK